MKTLLAALLVSVCVSASSSLPAIPWDESAAQALREHLDSLEERLNERDGKIMELEVELQAAKRKLARGDLCS